MPNEPINAALAYSLRKRRVSWRRIGIELARQVRRELPYLAVSVERAVARYKEAGGHLNDRK